jgi:hypothetical protein
MIAVPSAMAQSASCTGVTPNNTFTAALVGNAISGSPAGFGSVNFSLSGTQATVTARSLGLGSNITGITLFRGTPGNVNAVPVQTFSNSTNGFTDGQFAGTLPLDSILVSQIQSNPANFFFVINTAQFPSGAVAGSLLPARPQLIAGRLSGLRGQNGATGSGAFILTIGPNNGTGNVPLNFDIRTFDIGNGINSVAVTPTLGGTPLVVLGSNTTADNGRMVGSTMISTALAQQLLTNPCGFTLSLSTPSFPQGAVAGALAAGNELFVPVAGSADGINGTRFRTDLSVFNNSTIGSAAQSASAFLQFFPTAGAATASSVNAQTVNIIDVPPRGTMTFRDISNTVFAGAINGIGALRIVSPASLFGNARIYDDQISNGHGTTGQSEPGMFRSQALQQGVLVGVGVEIAPAGVNLPSYRANVGFFNPNENSTIVALELRDGTGNVLSSRQIALGAWAQTQMPLVGLNGLFADLSPNVTNSSVYFLSGMPVYAYASIIDNITGDASFMTPSFQP